MNIFYIDRNPVKAAKYHTNVHVCKMVVESAQLLSTAHRVLDPDTANTIPGLYKKTHVNHPSAIWVRQSVENYMWLYNLFAALCKEYTLRYKKVHLTEKKLLKELATPPKNIPNKSFTQPTLAMPSEYHRINHVEAYREYYRQEKRHLAKWSTEVPPWYY